MSGTQIRHGARPPGGSGACDLETGRTWPQEHRDRGAAQSGPRSMPHPAREPGANLEVPSLREDPELKMQTGPAFHSRSPFIKKKKKKTDFQKSVYLKKLVSRNGSAHGSGPGWGWVRRAHHGGEVALRPSSHSKAVPRARVHAPSPGPGQRGWGGRVRLPCEDEPERCGLSRSRFGSRVFCVSLQPRRGGSARGPEPGDWVQGGRAAARVRGFRGVCTGQAWRVASLRSRGHREAHGRTLLPHFPRKCPSVCASSSEAATYLHPTWTW